MVKWWINSLVHHQDSICRVPSEAKCYELFNHTRILQELRNNFLKNEYVIFFLKNERMIDVYNYTVV